MCEDTKTTDPMSAGYDRTLYPGKPLECGCCGDWFPIWDGYEDQDQDNGYGICKECQNLNEADNEKRYDKMYQAILDGVEPEMKEKIEAQVAENPDMKYAWVNHALDIGALSIGFGPA